MFYLQEYIDKPLLLDGYKFDLRVYVVVARLDPIEIYLCKVKQYSYGIMYTMHIENNAVLSFW